MTFGSKNADGRVEDVAVRVQMSGKKQHLLLLHRAYILLVSLGFFYQIVAICDLYFKYATSSQFLQDARDRQPLPDFSLCFRYPEIMNESSKSNIKDPVGSPSDRFFKPDDILSGHTVMKIFDSTPDPSQLMAKCFLRDPENPHRIINRTGIDCLSLFEVQKFFMQEFLCYRTRVRNSSYISFGRVSHTIFFGNVFYIMVLSETFDKSFALKPVVFNGFVPLVSRNYAPLVIRFSDFGTPDARITSNMYRLSYQALEFHLKPLPYDTKCNPDINQSKCLQACIINETKAQIGRVPFTEIIMEPFDMLPLTYSDALSLEENVTRIESFCEAKCWKRTCNYDYTVTTVDSSL